MKSLKLHLSQLKKRHINHLLPVFPNGKLTVPARDGLAVNQQGATAIIVGVSFMVLVAAIGISIDLARTYAVQSKAQNALDAALLGATATANSNVDAQGNNLTVEDETKRLFNANYPDDYMGATTGALQVSQSASDSSIVYTATVNLGVPNTIMSIFDHPSTQLKMLSQVTGTQKKYGLEMTLVLDNTGSMNCAPGSAALECAPSSGSKLESLKVAAADLTNILYSNAHDFQNIYMSIVPFSTHVNLGSNGSNWIQAAFVPKYSSNYCCDGLFTTISPTGNHYLANRTADSSPDNVHNEFTDAPPTNEATQFRTPYAYGLPDQFDLCGYPYNNPDTDYNDDPYNQPFDQPDASDNYYYYDFVCPATQPLSFALNNEADVTLQLKHMVAGGETRINVGLMWGWFTLSPNWAGVWNPGLADLPKPLNGLNKKYLVLMTDGTNSVYSPTGDVKVSSTNDDTTTSNMCTAIKASGITVYVIGFGTPATVNEDLLRDCASGSDHYFLAPNQQQLDEIFKQIADNAISETLRLSQ